MAPGGDPLSAAIRALRAELQGGPPAVLDRDVRELAELLSRRDRRRAGAVHDPVEQELVSAFPDAAALVSKEGWVRISNAAFDTLAANGRAEGLTPLEITRSAELSEAVKRALEGTARRLELPLGREIYVVDVSPLLRGEVLLLMRDVTERRRAEATRRDFVANASHELRTPIAAIAAAAETLLAGAIEEPSAAREFVGIVSRHAERLTRLAEDLLDLSRIESRQWRFEVAPVDVRALAGQVLDLVGAPAREKELALRNEVPDGASVHADAHALEMVLVNLAENAVKFTERGSVAIGAAREGAAWAIAVADTGPGIERHHLPRIFERFYRVDPGRSRDLGGTGLGLSIAKHLVLGMGGEIDVESGAGGTTFRVRLPAAS